MRTSQIGIGRARYFARVPLLVCLTVALAAPAGVSALGSKDGGKTPAASAPAAAAPAAQVAPTLPASGPLKLDADRAVSLALENNLGLRSGRIDVAAKQRKVDTAWNVFIPTVDVGGTMGRWNAEKSASAVIVKENTRIAGTDLYSGAYFYSGTLPDWLVSGSIQAQLMINVALFEGMKNLQIDYEAGRITYEQAKVRLERDVRKSYFSILLLKENISMMEDTIVAAERRVKQAQDNYRAGLAPELTVLQARVSSENLKPALEEMKNGLDASLSAFAMNLGLPRGVKLVLENTPPPDFVELNADKLLETASSDRLDVQSLLTSLRYVESMRKLTTYQLYTPSIILGWNYDPTFSGDPWKNPWFGDSDYEWKQSSGMFRATLSFRLNGLLPFTREALGLKDLDESKEKLNIALAQTIRGMELEVDSIVQKLEKSRRSVGTLALNVDLADRAYRLSEEAYKAGAKDLLDVQNSELELRKARLEVLKEKSNYLTGLLDLEYAIGVPFGTLTRKAK
jgi:outer membrane protein TolC